MLGDELELVGSSELGSFEAGVFDSVEDVSADDEVGVCDDVAATATGAYAAVARTKPSDAVIAAQARRAGARMAVLSYRVQRGRGGPPLGACGEGTWRNDQEHQE